MPFTFSHPAIILPLNKQKRNVFSLTGLITGSMIPDFEFIFRLRETDCFGHTWLGIFILDIPLAIVLSFVFHHLIRNPFIFHLPKTVRQRFTDLLYFDWKKYFTRNIVKFILSVLIGIASHVFLDAFTHKYGLFVKMHPFFMDEWSFMPYHLQVYSILQLLTSLVGAIYIAWVVSKMKKGYDISEKVNYAGYWLILIILGLILYIIRYYVFAQYRTLDDLIIAFVGAYVYALILVSVYYHKRIKKAMR